MPYEWTTPAPDENRLHLWPYRSLPRKGFVWFIGMTATLIALPLLVLVGSPVLWGLLPFLLLTIAGIWWALDRSYRDGEIIEDLFGCFDDVARDERRTLRSSLNWIFDTAFPL